jgi:hypothetical protein
MAVGTPAIARMPAKQGTQQQQEWEHAGRDASGRVYISNSKDASIARKPAAAMRSVCMEGRDDRGYSSNSKDASKARKPPADMRSVCTVERDAIL